MEPEFLPLEFEWIAPDQQHQRAREMVEEMQRRRSVRHFSSRSVDFELIESAVRAASTAPSGANRQPWTFVVVDDPAVKREIRRAAEAEEKRNYEERFPQEWKDALKPLGTSWRKEFLEIAPYLIVVFRHVYGLAQVDKAYPFPGQEQLKHYYVMESVGIAVGFLLMALHRMGLATLTHTPSPMNFLAKILERPKNERPYLLIPVGYPAEDATVPNIGRKPLDEVMVRIDSQRGA